MNNAGIGRYSPAELESDEVLQSVFATNVFGPIKLTRKLLPSWKERQSGHVLTVTSVAGLIGMAFSSTYAATKFAVEGHHESLAMELIPFENIKYAAFTCNFVSFISFHLIIVLYSVSSFCKT